MDRRTLLGMMLAATAVPARAAPSRTRLDLWPGTPPGGGGPGGREQTDDRGAVSDVARPWLEVVAPARPNGAAVLVAGGGGYKRIEMASEAHPAAAWLAAHGITAFVLTYRLPPEGWAAGPLAPLQDAQRAIRLIRAEGRRLGLDPQRLGLLGFSAGGHLMGLAATRSAFRSYDPVDAADMAPAHASAAALIYPVVTLLPPYDHTSTRKSLVGMHPSRALAADWSVETHVRSGCPPLFLVQAEDDPISDPANTLILADAARRLNVPVELHRLPSGGHGFGMGRPGSPTGEWPGWYLPWLRRNGLA